MLVNLIRVSSEIFSLAITGMVWISILLIIAITIIFIGMLLILISTLFTKDRKTERRSEIGGVIVIGPIPFAFGTSERIVKNLLIISMIFFIAILAIFIVLNSDILFLK